jgi:hypothetical protein
MLTAGVTKQTRADPITYPVLPCGAPRRLRPLDTGHPGTGVLHYSHTSLPLAPAARVRERRHKPGTSRDRE